MKKKIYVAKPVEGCEQCELLTEVYDDATACDECIEYGEAEIVEIEIDVDEKEI